MPVGPPPRTAGALAPRPGGRSSELPAEAIPRFLDAGEHQAFLRLFADTMPGMVAYWDTAEVCRFANQAHIEWFGEKPEDVIGHPMRSLYGPARYTRERRHIAAVLHGVPQSFECRLTNRFGETGCFLTKYVPHLVDDALAGFGASLTEITPLRSAQLRLEAAYADLLAERDRADAAGVMFEQLFENAPDAILLVDTAGAVVRANKATLTTLRVRPEDLSTTKIEDFLPGWQRASHAAHRSAYMSTGVRGPMSPCGTVTASCGDASTVEVHVSLAKLRIDGQWLVIVHLRDLSELSQTYTRLAQSNMALEQTTTAQRQFIYIASHDLREPMNTLSNFTGLLLEDHSDQLDDTARRYLGYIHDSAARMRALLDDLLGYIRLEQAELRMEPVALQDVMAGVEDDLSSILQTRQARLAIGALPVVDGQPSLLRVLLQNLVDNATKFQPDGRVPLVEIMEVSRGTSQPASGAEYPMCEIVVADNGIGIDQDHLERVFEIFRRSHSHRQFPGTGIGLAVCRRIAQLHGGQIWAEADVAEGTRIHVTLPRSTPPSTADDPPAETTPALQRTGLEPGND